MQIYTKKCEKQNEGEIPLPHFIILFIFYFLEAKACSKISDKDGVVA